MNLEPFTAENNDRFVLFPLKEANIWDMYKKQVECFWTAEEIDFNQDLKDWDKLTDNERHYIKHVLAFFAASDGIVTENLAVNMMKEITNPEARCFYGFQIAMENIHSETYSLLIDTYIKDEDEKDKLFNAIDHFPAVREKAEWAMKWMSRKNCTTAERLVAFAAVEGIFFSGSFCAIFWLKKRGLMPGLTFSNELISRDEGMHCEFACMMHEKLNYGCDKDTIKRIITEAVTIEQKFVTEALPVGLVGMNETLMKQYIEFVADFWLQQLGCEKVYNAENPFPWMDFINLQGKTNFFERRVGEYRKASINMGNEFELSEDF